MSYDLEEKRRYGAEPLECYFFELGASSWSYTSADQAITIQLQRYTTSVGTSTGITAAAAANLDFGDLAAFTSDARNEITASPTLTANSLLYSRTFNQKYGCEYYAPSDDASIWFPAVNINGIFWDTPILNPATGSKIKVLAHFYEG